MLKKKNLRWIYLFITSISLALLSIVVLTVFEYTAVAEVREHFTEVDQQDPLEYGKLLFDTRGCASCHATAPDVKSLGPNLLGISQRKTSEYIRQSIVSPDAVIAAGFEQIVMPNFGEILNDSQVDALVEYVGSLRK